MSCWKVTIEARLWSADFSCFFHASSQNCRIRPMSSNSNTIKPPAALHAWQKCLDIEGQEAAHYRDHVNVPLFEVIDGTPRRVLELGCATGKFGDLLKQRFPEATVVGIEAGRKAAA